MPPQRFSRSQHLIAVGQDQYICKHCNYGPRAFNATRAQIHLDECKPWQQQLIQQAEAKQTIRPSNNLITRYTTSAAVDIDPGVIQLARACYYGGLPFSFYDSNPHLHEFFKQLGTEPPTREQLRDQLLDIVYSELLNEVNSNYIQPSTFINISVDESTTISARPVANIYITLPDGRSIYYKTFSTENHSLRADQLAQEYMKNIRPIFGGDMTKIVSIVTDTCSTARAVQTAMKIQHPSIIAVGSDSHGIELLVKDLLGLDGIKQVAAMVKSIVSFFESNPQQLNILRKHQRIAHNRERAIVTSSITRRGSHWSPFNALLQSQHALNAYSADPEAAGTSCLGILTDHHFWRQLYALAQLIQPITELQKSSESLHSSVAQVHGRWKHLRNFLNDYCTESRAFAGPVQQYLDGHPTTSASWARRYSKQLTPVHTVAHLLDPSSMGIPLDDHEAAMVQFEALVDQVCELSARQPAKVQFRHYRSYQANFSREGYAWRTFKREPDPKAFWQAAYEFAPEMADFALKVLSIPASNIGSERSFSEMPLLQSRRSNELSYERLNKLIFLYINKQFISRRNEWGETQNQHELEEDGEDEDEMEYILLEMEDQEIGRTGVPVSELLNDD